MNKYITNKKFENTHDSLIVMLHKISKNVIIHHMSKLVKNCMFIKHIFC